MDDFFALIAALFEALGARNRPARVPTPVPPAPRPSTPRPSTPPSAAAVPPSPALAPTGVTAAPGERAMPRRAAPAGQPPEAGRVTALFANPQSLVAAFIVAEVL